MNRAEPGGSGDYEQPRPNGNNPDGSRDTIPARRETLDRGGRRHGSHDAKVHDIDDQ
jgi:hypothetical protein